MSGKKIDMSSFIGQDFDCEFWASPYFQRVASPVGNILRIDEADVYPYTMKNNDRTKGVYGVTFFGYCRPRLNHWHFNDGSMVLPKGLVVEFMLRNGVDLIGVSAGRDSITYREGITPALICLSHASPICMSDIIAVKIIGVHPNYSEWGKAHGMEVVEL